MKDLNLKLNIGLMVNETYTRDITLLKSNAISEEVYTRKFPEKPYTWIGNVIAISTAHIGSVSIGSTVRDEYLKTKSINIPKVVMDLPIADANSLLLEIHRRCWENLLPQQEILCKYCAKKVFGDIDLDKIELSEKSKELLGTGIEYVALECTLKGGIVLDEFINKLNSSSQAGAKREDMEQFLGVTFNRVIFRIPTLRDAIKNETYVTKEIDFWRRVALDCIISIDRVEEGNVVSSFPMDKLIWLGLNLFNYMEGTDLKKIRHTMREELPTMPFAYTEECPCDMKREIPYVMEASSFFSA